MKRLLLLLVVALIALPLHSAERKKIPRFNTLTNTWASYSVVTIHDIQYVAPESLALADVHQVSADVASPYWKEQTSPLMGDTVVVEAQVIVPCGSATCGFGGITFTAHGWTMLLHDTAANSNEWGGILVRVGGTAGSDSTRAILDYFNSPERGDIIRITGTVEEFPADRINSTTQLHPVPGILVEIIGSKPVPAPTRVPVSDFYIDAYPGGSVKYSTGERWEGSLVELTNLTVISLLNTTRGTWTMTDASGNYISDLDISYNFTLGSSETPNPIVPDTSITHFHVPPVNAVVDTLKGTIMSNSGGENPRGFRICPLFPGDIVYGKSLPTVDTHRRNPVAPHSTDSVAVQARVVKTLGGYNIASAHLFVSVNNGPWDDRPMTLMDTNSNYQAYIIDADGNPWPPNTAVKYFIKAFDVSGNSSILANSSPAVGRDTSQGFFFYTVLDRLLTIHDVQYTPYPNGRTGYLGAVVSVSGIITADSSDIAITPLNVGGTNAWFIQDGTAPWSGIWVVKRDSATGLALGAMKRGDSVTVTGSVQENFDVTRIFDSLVTIHATGRPVPAPVTLATGTLGTAGNGNPAAEPYEGMLVRLVNTQVSSVDPTFADFTEYEVNDGSGGVILRRDGLNTYSNLESDTTGGKTHILHVSDRVDTLIGVLYFSFSHYKLVPRKDVDFTAGEPYKYANNWNMVSVGRNQLPASTAYAKTVLYPGAISNVFYYSGGYQSTSQIEHRKGYWVKFPSARTIRQLGKRRTSDTVFVATGWNLIGALGNPVVTSSIAAYPSGNHLSQFYEYNGVYQIQDSLLPSRGLWVKASMDGYFLESAPVMIPKLDNAATHVKQSFNTLTISDNAGHSQVLYFGEDREGKLFLPDYEMPPAAPDAEGFDVRYASGRILEAYPKLMKSGMEFGITVTAERGPVMVSWNVVTTDGKRFILGDMDNGKVLKPKELAGSGTLTIGQSGVVRLNLSVNGSPALPKEFSLGQNYPNPFNPLTKFEVALPQASHLEVAIYNILGQKVLTLADEARDAGYHTLIWDGNTSSGVQASSGIYFVRMTAEKFAAVRKILMMK